MILECTFSFVVFPLKLALNILILCLVQVKNFVSLGGPHAGIASVPLCGVSALSLPLFILFMITSYTVKLMLLSCLVNFLIICLCPC